tara:strand:+ start:791 stop:961 length:171 start_codon:yes stop_codon:yes gene_type:complete
MAKEIPSPKKFKIETPVGTLESDSGSHFVDVISVLGVIVVLYIGKKLVGKFFNRAK